MLPPTIANPESQWLNAVKVYVCLLSVSYTLWLCHLEELLRGKMEETNHLLDLIQT